jgi:tRNA threonylcarbamoyladenosine modification (KEOPS) complex Cgi121 subunit
MSAVPSPGRLLKVAAAVVAGLLYVWFAAVRAVPQVKRRRAAQRAARRYGG